VFSSNTTKTIKETLLNDKYFNKSKIKDIDDSLSFLEHQQRDTANSRGFNDVAKYVISVTYQEINDFSISEFHFDHIVPFAKLERKFKQGRNSLGNCGLLKAEDNREKSDTFIPEKFASDKMVDVFSFDNKQKEEYKTLLTNVKLKDFGKKELEELYEYRFNLIKDRFISKLSTFINS
jgi:hypothetical protein